MQYAFKIRDLKSSLAASQEAFEEMREGRAIGNEAWAKKCSDMQIEFESIVKGTYRLEETGFAEPKMA